MDRIFESWLERQHAEGAALAAASDVLSLWPEPDSPPRRYVASFDCQTMVRTDGEAVPWRGCEVLIQFPPDYLRLVPDPAQIVALMSPPRLFHPNVAPPFLCIGRIAPGTRLCELLVQLYEILTFQKLTPREDDALNRDACAWARRNMHRFPLDTRPLRRRAAEFEVTALDQGAPNESRA